MAKYETPGDSPASLATITIKMPEGNDSLSAFLAHMEDLTKSWLWEDSGGLTIEETVQFWTDALTETTDENPYT